MEKLKELREYLSSGFISSRFYMSTVRDQIRYIYEPIYSSISIMDKNTYSAKLIGLYAMGRFYSLSYEYRNFDLDFMEELQEFEIKYDEIFEKQMKHYNAGKPIGGKVSKTVSEKLEYYIAYDLPRAVTDIIFGVRNTAEKKPDHRKYETIFLRYILLGNKCLEEAVNAEINENADELNFKIMSEDLAYKYAVIQLNTESMISRVTLYGKIKKTGHSQYRLSVNFENKILDNIYIDTERLLRVIKLNEEITGTALSSTDRRKLESQNVDLTKLKFDFEDILKIEYGQHLLYIKAA